MNVGSLIIRTLVVIAVLFLLYLAGALTFPALSVGTNETNAGLTGLLFFLLAIVLLAVVGTLLARGIRSVKRSGEAILMGFVGALFMGGILVIFAQLNVPYTVRVNSTWTGTSWYSSFLSLLFIGIPLMFVFLIGE